MKLKLAKIYQDVSNGKLTKEEALERIRAIKLLDQDQTIGTLLASPVWESRAEGASLNTSQIEYAQQHIILCEMPQVNGSQLEALIPHSHSVHLQAAPQRSIAERYSEYGIAIFSLIHSVLTNKPQGKVLIQIVTANSQEQAIFAGFSGLLKTAALENPQLIGQVIITQPQIMADQLAGQLREDQVRPKDSIVKHEQGVRHVLTWNKIKTAQSQPMIAFKDHGVYLITGGLGGLGILLAREILQQTSKSLIILTDRSELTSSRKAVLDTLPVGSSTIEYRQADISNLDQVKQLITSITDGKKQLNGIIHCAGIALDNFILKKTDAEFRQVLAPKVTGTFNLDQASYGVDLDFMVLFSSATSCFGNLGQADYAMANGFMDQFAAYRNRLVAAGQRQGQTVAANWPLWQEGGMSIDLTSQEMLRQTFGMRPMSTKTGMHALHLSLELKHDQILVIEGDMEQIQRALFGDQTIQEEPSLTPFSLNQPTVTKVNPEDLAETTQDYLCKQFSTLLKLASHKIDPQAPLERYGIDSILAMKLTQQLEQSFGSLPKTLFFEYQSIHELAGYFIKFHSPQLAILFATEKNNEIKLVDKQPEPQIRHVTRKRISRQRHIAAPTEAIRSVDVGPIAIIGVSGRYPEAVNIEAYWRNLRDGKDCIIEVPKSRWDWREYYSEDRNASGYHFSKWGGFIEGVDEFDPRFFNISPREAESIDPQERLFLQHAWMAIEDAGYSRAGLQIPHEKDMAGQVGVYVGVMYGEYQLFAAQASALGKRMGISGSYASISNRVSYALNVHGPSMTLDTMCSSSLTAIHLACQDLKHGRTDLAIAGGVNVSIHPNKYLMLSAGQFISGDGHCQSFGEGGDGYIPGEGVGAVILKRLVDAERDGDHIYGIIKGSALNHGGKTNGYSVPNPHAQASTISRALTESNTDPRHISYIEAHGTGTKLGDPIEIAAMSKAFNLHTQDTGFCMIGSAKSNIGHCESAAGIAGITKILLQMKHQQIVPSLHSTRLNPHIDFQKTPFIVNQTLRTWEPPVVNGRPLPRIAGISSFGAGGSNAHIIVQEYVSPAGSNSAKVLSGQGALVIIPLSARTAEQLKQKAHDLLDFIKASEREEQTTASPMPIDLLAMSYTLQVGREAMEERLGFMVNSVGQLADKLQSYVNGDQDIDGVYQGQVKRNKDTLSMFAADADLQLTIEKWVAQKKVSKLLDLWVKGLDLDWNKLYGETKPRRISLPTYPFAKERYWLDTSVEIGGSMPKPLGTSVLHPLLHVNTSDLSQQSYRSSFSGEESFLADHYAGTSGGGVQKVLPSAVYMEMARVAAEQASPTPVELGTLELRDTAWAELIVVSKDRPVSIALSSGDDGGVDYEIYSQSGGEEVVYCQGRAVISREPVPAQLSVESIRGQMRGDQIDGISLYAEFARKGLVQGSAYQGIIMVRWGDGQLLAQLRLPSVTDGGGDAYQLHPSMVEGALQCGIALISTSGQLPLPYGFDSLRVVRACTGEMFAWARYASGGSHTKLDIDLCDQQGNICAQFRGVDYRGEPLSVIVQESSLVAPVEVHPVPRQIFIASSEHKKNSFSEPQVQEFTQVELEKPKSVSLVVPGTMVIEDKGLVSHDRIPITLLGTVPSLQREVLTTGTASVGLFDHGGGVYSIRVDSQTSGNTLSYDLIDQLLCALDNVKQTALAKVLMICGTKDNFLRGGRDHYNAAVERKLYQAITSFPYPVIAVMQGDAVGAGFLVGALCDFMICSRESKYYYTDLQGGLFPSAGEHFLLGERFGEALAVDLLYGTSVSTGDQLRERGWNCPIVSQGEVDAYAHTLASGLAIKSADSLKLLKQHLGRHIHSLTQELSVVEPMVKGEQSGTSYAPISSPGRHIQLDTPVERVLVVSMRAIKKKYGLKDVVSDMKDIFSQIKTTGQYRAVVIVSDHLGFIPVLEQDNLLDVVSDFQHLVVDSPIPVIAVLGSSARDVVWLMSQFCDACVYDADGKYCAAGIMQTPALVTQAATIFPYRLGRYAGSEVLLTGREYSGTELQQRVGALAVVGHGQALSKAVEMAMLWVALPMAAVTSWKQEMASGIRKRMEEVPTWAGLEDKPFELLGKIPTPVALSSRVITAIAHPEGILVVRMEDREAKNMFSDAFVRGMEEVFAHIEQTPAYKVVVLTGYDSYFASGGTKESLVAIQEGKAKFTDTKIYQVAMDCRVPVIAAMQGHGIGAGWAMGMFADLILFSEESHYVSPYMGYGFTPGAGATLIFPDKVGYDLARETLLTAQEYAGSELKGKGLPIPVLPREQVDSTAFTLARQVAQASRGGLIALKQQLTEHLHCQLEETYRLELAMHESTFVGQSETLRQIHSNFFQKEGEPQAEVSPALGSTSTATLDAPQNADVLPGVIASLKKLLAQELHLQEQEIDENSQFVDLGLDSIIGVTWIRKINQKYKTSIEATKIYSYATLLKLSRYVKEEAEKSGTLSDKSVTSVDVVMESQSKTPPRSKIVPHVTERKLTSRRTRTVSRLTLGKTTIDSSQPIAVIGMAGQFPQSKNLEEFWENIAQGQNCISEVSQKRWDIGTYYNEVGIASGKTNSKWIGAMEEYDMFDPLFFTISPIEAENMDPQQRVFLQTCWHTIENAGYNPQTLSGSKCGVFVGCATGDYHLLSREQQLSAQGFTGGSVSILAARISYFLNLQGPCISIDTACSSSLVAIANACDSLTLGSSDLALAGGVYVMAGPDMHIKTSQSGMLSPDGRCYTFDQRANGFVPGEGVGVVMLKRLSDAEKDNDTILGVIQGWGVNQDGKTNGITAPNAESQTRLEQEVYDKYRIDPTSIQLIETHGTGTKLGDPIEVEGLRESFKKYTQTKGYCALGSVKSNIGHCLTAAGVAGFIKILLSLKHKQLPPTINFDQLNEHIQLNDSPFYINTQLKEWGLKGSERRQAAISAFGFSGTNAHMVVAEYTSHGEAKQPVSAITQNTKIIIPLSARTAEQLRQKAIDLLEFIRKEGSSIDLLEMAYTLQVGREAMEERLGFMAGSINQLAEKLGTYINGEQDIEDVYQGQVKRNKEGLHIISQDNDMKETIIEKWIAQKKLSKLLDLWVKGLELDWNKLYGDYKPKRISLPTYPFAKERYWIDATASEQIDIAGMTTSVLHPLLHINTSDFSQQSYSSTFSGEEFFLKDHLVFNQKILPGVAYLEMVRVAVEQSMPTRPESTILELHNTVWIQPFVVNHKKQISIVLFANDAKGHLDEQIDYEIYSQDKGEEITHCQGHAIFSRRPAPAKLDIMQLKGRMRLGKLDKISIYAAFTQMGFHYGPAHQGVTAIYQGERQVLAYLTLPTVVDTGQNNYLLHPSLMDSALQASIGLFSDLNQLSTRPLLPFALDSLRIISACTKEMVVWVRYSLGSKPEDKLTKLDIDLCDPEGNVCVQIQGFASRVMESSINPIHYTATNDSISKNTDEKELNLTFNDVYYQKLIESVLNKEVSADEAVELA